MNIREFLNNNSAAATIVAVVILVVSLGIIMLSSGGGGATSIDIFYYDMNTKQLFVAPSSEIPPIDTGSGEWDGGGAGMRAVVYSCSDSCDTIDEGMTLEEVEAAGGGIAYIERYTEKAKSLIQRQAAGETISPEEEATMMTSMTEVSKPGGDEWVPMESDAGMRLMQELADKCPGGTVSYCMPQ